MFLESMICVHLDWLSMKMLLIITQALGKLSCFDRVRSLEALALTLIPETTSAKGKIML